MKALSLLHVLNLDTIGGVESLYIHYLQKSVKKKFISHDVYQHTIISGKRCHDLYKPIFADLHYRPFQEQYLARLRLPRFLRWIVEIRRGMIENIIEGPCRWVFWNRIEETSPLKDYIYYEHGASWMENVTKKKKEFIENSSQLVANSKAAQILMSHKWHVPLESIKIINNPLRPDIQILSSHRKAPQNKLVLGFIGRLTAIKVPSLAIYTLYDLVIHHKYDATLHIAGHGPEKEFLQTLILSLGLESRVHFLGIVQDLPKFYDSIDFLLIPSLREPFGLVALEASARGVPVIATCIDGLYESVQDRVSGILVEPTLDVHDKKSICQFLSSTKAIPEMVVHPKQHAVIAPKLVDPTAFSSAIISILSSAHSYENLSLGGIQHTKTWQTCDAYIEQLLTLMAIPYPSDESEHIDESEYE